MAVRYGPQQCLRSKDRSMIRWICGTQLHDRTPSINLLDKLGIPDIVDVLGARRLRRLRWYGHVMRSSASINNIHELPLPGNRSRDRPLKSWISCVNHDIKEKKLD